VGAWDFTIHNSLCYNHCMRHSSSIRTCHRKGFTLVELLIVIAIIAILAVVLVFVLNPVEMAKSARDTTRLSDIYNVNTAIGLYVADVSTAKLGSSSIAYLSIPDPSATTTAGTDCSSLGFPSGYFHCAASSTYRNSDGTGWIPVNFASVSTGNPLSQLPVDPVNTTSSEEYYAYTTDGTNYKISAAPEAQKSLPNLPNFSQGSFALQGGFPNTWVKVPGNSTFGTNDFYVMKYDAKCADNKGSLLTAPQDSSYQTYKDNNSATSTCTTTNTKQVVSAPSGYPIADISHNTALTYCKSIGAHLLTNDEYMTIVTNAASQGSNWYGGTVGTNYIYSGHNDNSPANALQASGDDTQGYYGETNTGGNQRRTLTLSNGQVIWDMAGNVWEHVQRSVNNQGDLVTTMALPTCSDNGSGWEWCQYGNSTTPYISAWSSDVVKALVAPPNSSWNSTQGMGQVYTYGTGVNQGTTVFLRGAIGAMVRLRGHSHWPWVGARAIRTTVWDSAVPGSRRVDIWNLKSSSHFSEIFYSDARRSYHLSENV